MKKTNTNRRKTGSVSILYPETKMSIGHAGRDWGGEHFLGVDSEGRTARVADFGTHQIAQFDYSEGARDAESNTNMRCHGWWRYAAGTFSFVESGRCRSHGGKLAENVTQALARDLLAELFDDRLSRRFQDELMGFSGGGSVARRTIVASTPGFAEVVAPPVWAQSADREEPPVGDGGHFRKAVLSVDFSELEDRVNGWTFNDAFESCEREEADAADAGLDIERKTARVSKMSMAQKKALLEYAEAGDDAAKQALLCISIRWHAKVAGALEKRGLLGRRETPFTGMFRITELGVETAKETRV